MNHSGFGRDFGVHWVRRSQFVGVMPLSQVSTEADSFHGRPLTAKGRARRRRIVDTAVGLLGERSPTRLTGQPN